MKNNKKMSKNCLNALGNIFYELVTVTHDVTFSKL